MTTKLYDMDNFSKRRIKMTPVRQLFYTCGDYMFSLYRYFIVYYMYVFFFLIVSFSNYCLLLPFCLRQIKVVFVFCFRHLKHSRMASVRMSVRSMADNDVICWADNYDASNAPGKPYNENIPLL